MLGEFHDWRRQRRAEEQRLPLGRNLAEHLLDGREEAHIEHPVRFVENQHVQLAEVHVAPVLAHMVEEPPGRGDNHIGVAPEGRFLRPHPHAAEDCRARDARVLGQLHKVRVYLRREFTGGREHEGARGARGVLKEAVEQREKEGARLAAAGHCTGKNVPALAGWGDGVELDGGGLGPPEVGGGAHKGRRKAEGIE